MYIEGCGSLSDHRFVPKIVVKKFLKNHKTLEFEDLVAM